MVAARRKQPAKADPPEWLHAFLLEDWHRRLEAARKLGAQRRMELDAGFHRVRTVDDIRTLNARYARIDAATARQITAEVAYRRHDTKKNRRAYASAGMALLRAGKTVPEHEGVELDALVDEALKATDAERLALIVEKIEYRMQGLIGRDASRFATYYHREKARPARQSRARRMNNRRHEKQPEKVDAAIAIGLKTLAEGLTVGDALDAIVDHTGWRRAYARQAIGGVRRLVKLSQSADDDDRNMRITLQR